MVWLRFPMESGCSHLVYRPQAPSVFAFMFRRRLFAVGCFVAVVLFINPFSAADEKVVVAPNHAAQMREGLTLFKSRVGSILRKHCLACHGGEATKGDFDLSSREKLLASGYVELSKSAESHFIAVIKHETEPVMPKDGESKRAMISR